MTNETPNLPALRPQGTELDVARPASSLVSRIAGDAYRHLPSPTAKLWRVGDYEVNEQAYQQIMIWLDEIKVEGRKITLEGFARAQSWTPEVIVNFLSKQVREKEGVDIRADQLAMIRLREAARKAQVELASRNLVEIKLPFISAKVIDGNISPIHLSEFINHESYEKFINISDKSHASNWIVNNQIKSVRLFGLKRVDLSNVPKLKSLYCYGNELELLDIPRLEYLYIIDCSNNNISELDISKAPKLNELNCRKNKLMNLDLSNSQMLRKLCCDSQVTFPQKPLKDIDITECLSTEFEFFMENQFSIRKRSDQIVRNWLWTA
jgi:hypothetical protein